MRLGIFCTLVIFLGAANTITEMKLHAEGKCGHQEIIEMGDTWEGVLGAVR